MSDFIQYMIFFVVVMGLLLGVCFIPAYFIDKSSCYSRYASFEPEYRGLVTGCMVNYDGKLIPAEALRITD